MILSIRIIVSKKTDNKVFTFLTFIIQNVLKSHLIHIDYHVE